MITALDVEHKSRNHLVANTRKFSFLEFFLVAGISVAIAWNTRRFGLTMRTLVRWKAAPAVG
jgi:hypothetical protein